MAKTPYQLWKESQEKEARGQSTVPRAPYRAVQYSNPTYKGKSEDKSYKWETQNLKPMKSSKNARSYNDKFSNWAKNNGLSSTQTREFRTWLDSKEDGVKTNQDFMSETLKTLRKRNEADAERIKNNPKQTEEPKIQVPKPKNSFLKDIGAGFKAAGQAINPFDDVSVPDALMSFANRDKSKGFQELQRGSNRTVDSASLGALSAIDRKMTGDTPYYMTQRKVGEGGGTDMITSGLGYLVPGAGAYKALGLTKAGKGLEVLAQQGVKQRLASEAAKGAITGAGVAGAEIGIREAITPEQYSASDNLKHLALGTGAGAVADPLLYGAGQAALRGLSRFAKGDVPTFTGKPSETTVNSLIPQPPAKSPVNTNYDSLIPKKTAAGEVLPEQQPYFKAKTELEQIRPQAEDLNREFQQAVEEQYQYLKNSMGKGVQQGGVVKDSEGYVTGAYGRISNNPKWYQDFYAANGRKPNDSELRELAEIHVREGFADEVGELPAWRPSAVQEIDDQIDQLLTILKQDPSQEPALRPILSALEEDKTEVLRSIESTQTKASTLQQQVEQLKPTKEPVAIIQKGRDYEPIEMLKGNGGPLKVGKPIDRTPIEINNPKEIVKRQIDTSTNKEKPKWSFDKAYTAIMDDLHPLNKATKELGGKDLPFDKNPYTQARLARGVAGKAETYLKGGVYTEDGKKMGSSLQEIIKPIEKKMDDFLAYVTSKRALDYDEKGLTAGIKPKDVEGMSDRQLADATIRQIEAESPEFAKHQQKLVKYSQSLMNELKESGYYTDDVVKAIFEDNPNYIPMNRVQPPKVRGFEPLTNPKNKFASLSDPIKKRTGSEKPIVNPIESIVKNTYIINNIAERNKVGVSLLNLLEQTPEENMWGRVVNVSKQDNSIDQLSSVLDEASTQIDSGKSDALDNLFKGEGNKVYVYRDGQKVEMELQEDLYKAMLSLDTQKQNFLIKMLAVPTRTLRAGAVLSPDFGPVNIFRDQLSALVNSKYGFVPFVDMFKGLTNVLKKDDVYWQWKNNGGANSVLSSLDREYLQGDLRKLIKEPFSDRVKRNLSDPKQLPLKMLDKAISPLRTVSEITEEATRVGEFRKGLKKGATPKEAAFASRDLIDFNRAGTVGRQFNQVTAFFNAAVQSMDKMARTFNENPKGATVKAITGITIPSVVAYAYNHDQEWYKEIPQSERDLYWHFKTGDQIYKLPKPFEAGVIFGTTAERFLDFMKTNDPAAFKDFDKTIKNTFTPPWLPTALTPWAEVYANKSMYFDSPIVPRREQDLLPEDQYGPYQSELSKAFGQLTKTSPRKAEHVFKGYTGGLGRYFLQGTDKVAETAGIERAELPDRGIADMPIISRFVVKNLEGNNQSVNDFYERLDEFTREQRSAKKNNVNNKHEAIYKQLNKLSRGISELQAEKRAIIEDLNMNGKQKTEKIKVIDRQITQIAKQGNGLK